MSAKRTDANQAAIMAELRKAGCSVQTLHVVGHGCPDLVVGHGGQNWLFEVKTPGGKMTQDEADWATEWRGQYHTVRSAEEALMLMGLLRRTL